MVKLSIKIPEEIVKREMTAKSLRDIVRSEVSFDFSVRNFGNGKFWVCPVFGSKNRMDHLIRILNANNFKTECNGKPGTSGEFIIDVMV